MSNIVKSMSFLHHAGDHATTASRGGVAPLE